MDKKELLKLVIDGIINEDNEAAAASFKEYTVLKVQSIIEADSIKKKVKKVEDKENEGCSDEDEAKKIIDLSNKDD